MPIHSSDQKLLLCRSWHTGFVRAAPAQAVPDTALLEHKQQPAHIDTSASVCADRWVFLEKALVTVFTS